MTTAADIFGRVQRVFGDMSSIQIEQQDIVDWMNDAQTDIIVKHPDLLPTSQFTDLSAAVSDYSLPSDLFALRAVYIQDGSGTYLPLLVLNANEFENWYGTNTPGQPVYYVRAPGGKKITLLPTPVANLSAGLRFDYNKYAPKLTDASEPTDLPQSYDTVFYDYCMMRAYEMDENWDMATRKQQAVESAIQRLSYGDNWMGQNSYPHTSVRIEDI